MASALAVALAGGCAAERPATAPADRVSREGSPPAAGARPEASAPYGADAVVARMLEQVSKQRGLVPLRAVRSVVLSRQQLVEAVRGRLETDVPEHVARGNEQVLFALRVVPVDFDYSASVLQLLGTQLAGFYDQDDETMYLAADLEPREWEATLAHELVHALQDQHFALGELLRYHEGAGDAQSAIHALAEGDATSAMADQMLAAREVRAIDLPEAQLLEAMRVALDGAEGTEGVPAILKRAALAPYVDGLAFVHWARRRGGWERVNQIWAAPLRSTEQVLHPEKLKTGEEPEAVPVPLPPPGGPWSLVYQDVLGELSVRLVLEEWLAPGEAQRAAQDWGGDRAAVFCETDRCAVAWHIRYDEEGAARRGLQGFEAGVLAGAVGDGDQGGGSQDTVAGQGGTLGGGAQPDEMCVQRRQRGPMLVARSGRDLVVAAGPYERSGGRAVAAGDCEQARAWAQGVLTQH